MTRVFISPDRVNIPTRPARDTSAPDPIGQKIKFEVFDRRVVDAPHNTYFEHARVWVGFHFGTRENSPRTVNEARSVTLAKLDMAITQSVVVEDLPGKVRRKVGK